MKIRAIHEVSRETCGSPCVHVQLAREGIEIHGDRIAPLMRAANLLALRGGGEVGG